MTEQASASRRLEGLHAWARRIDAYRAAAVHMLIAHGRWIDDPVFVDRCVEDEGDGLVLIDFDEVERQFQAGAFVGSSSERGMLELAIALYRDRFEFTSLDSTNRRLAAVAVLRALGFDSDNFTAVRGYWER